MKFTTAANAEQALDLRESRGIDLLVSDVILPAMSGLDLARLARERLPHLRVLLVSGYTGEAAPASERVLAKPYTADSLLAAIERVISASEAADTAI